MNWRPKLASLLKNLRPTKATSEILVRVKFPCC